MAGAILMGAGMGFSYYQNVEAGKEAKRQADFKADQIRKEEIQLSTMTQEKLYDIKQETYFAKGEAKAFGAMGGSGVGTESSLTLLNRIEGAAHRKSEVLTKSTGFQRAALLTEVSEYKKLGRHAQEAGRRRSYASLITGGYQLGTQYMGWGA